jgi:hypothetical protein
MTNERMHCYKSPDGQREIRPSFCVYMDVLGFVERVRIASQKEEDEGLLFQTMERALDLATAFLNDRNEMDEALWQHKLFTDNLVIGYPLDSEDMDLGEPEFGRLVRFACTYQAAMAVHGLFVRGGMSFGRLHIGDHLVYGPALIDAVKLEQEASRDPRITMTKEVVTLVNKHLDFYANRDGPQTWQVLADSDNQYFLNYLWIFAPHSDQIYWDEIRMHKEHIVSGLVEHNARPRVLSKFRWLAAYHNFFCSEFLAEEPGYTDEYLINPELAVLGPRRIN